MRGQEPAKRALTIAAAGAMETAACLAAFAGNRLPPTPNLTLDTVDPECVGLDHIVAGGLIQDHLRMAGSNDLALLCVRASSLST